MSGEKNITIELLNGTKIEYIIRDKIGITIGRFKIIELDKENKRASIRLKFYREDNYKLFKESISLIVNALFKDKEIYKVNVFVSDNTNINAFLDLGFILEGIIGENLFINCVYRDELIFGINRFSFKEKCKIIQFQLDGVNIDLRNLSPEHAEEMLDYYKRNENHLKNFEPSRDMSFYTYETQKNILLESYKQFIDGSSLDLGIFKDNYLIGKLKLSNIVYGIFKSAFLGYSIDEEYQGKGYMKEAVNLLCTYAFEEMGLHRIEASTLVDNKKSQGVLRSCGFKEVGLNEKYLYINGEWKDHITFCKIKE
ncbi:ribosomal-protein-alanine N-acetyltransferase [Clostridium cavendishii DSM 21758]|uniref:Ribosomal-protein-alanine N-acetyltransferase n=1 Tax=Clostridium cavendishii DSM 21758 TaxID=1121302 RepID=A0A1M6SZL3_9CLOT|nr:GNAT family protein [Clostridium cavendishii]SHK50193.1 ribosomal-protein-alanine N-acetyltransferase [Clostridium cavendishii DSM 21758]